MKTILPFLKKLKQNNNKDWFEKNKNNYLEAKSEMEELTNELISAIRKFDNQIDKNLEAKHCIFRIYKDVRFSKDKTPYKTNFGASINPGGRKSTVPGYYLHIQPGEIFVAGGSYMPMPDQLNAFRQEIDYNGKELVKIMQQKSFKSYFNGLDEIDMLKTSPKGFDKDHPYMDLLKHKHFIVSHTFNDKDLSSPGFVKEATKAFQAMYPFIQFLRHAQAN